MLILNKKTACGECIRFGVRHRQTGDGDNNLTVPLRKGHSGYPKEQTQRGLSHEKNRFFEFGSPTGADKAAGDPY